MKQLSVSGLYFKGEVFISHLFANSIGIVNQLLKMNKKYVKLDFQIESKKINSEQGEMKNAMKKLFLILHNLSSKPYGEKT